MTGLFYEADLEWLPQLIDIINKGDSINPDITERTYYARFGVNQIDHTGYTKITSHWSEFVQLFNERYCYRRINSETMEMWQTRLQRTFDEQAPKWERYFELYTDFASKMDEDIVDGWKETDTRSNQQSGSDQQQTGTIAGGTDTTTTSMKHIDTPDTYINASDNYADSLDKGSETVAHGRTDNSTTNVTYGRKDTRSGYLKHEESGDVVGMVNKAVETKRIIITDMVASFENCFLNVFWY